MLVNNVHVNFENRETVFFFCGGCVLIYQLAIQITLYIVNVPCFSLRSMYIEV